MTPNEKAEAAKMLLESPIMRAAFTDIRESLVSKLEGVPFGDTDTQHEVALMLQLLKRLQTQLHTYIQEQAMVKHRNQQDEFIKKTRQTLGTGLARQ